MPLTLQEQSAVETFSRLACLYNRIRPQSSDSRALPQLWPARPEPPSPNDHSSLQFHNMLLSLATMPTRWENQTLLDEALSVVPLQRIYDEAEEESELFAVEAASLASTAPPNTPITDFVPRWDYQDCVIRALLRWFRNDFFEWVNNPPCARCHSPTVGVGMAAASPEEISRGAVQVELYRCSNPSGICSSFERFPRYSDPFVLLQTKKGRVGEWANCFGMLCRAMGARVRWVWNSEDHVWIEVFSNHQNRWVHVDACEEAWDKPRLYTEGWGRKLAYCIAFSADGGASDVTRRYVRDPFKQALPRERATEPALAHSIQHIRSLRRTNLSPALLARQKAEDEAEEKELQGYFYHALMPVVMQDISQNKLPVGADLVSLEMHALASIIRLSRVNQRQGPALERAVAAGQQQSTREPAPITSTGNRPLVHAPNSTTATIFTPSSDLVDVSGPKTTIDSQNGMSIENSAPQQGEGNTSYGNDGDVNMG